MKRTTRTTQPSTFAYKVRDTFDDAGRDKPRPYAVATLALLFAAASATAAESVTVVSWGGSYERACVEGYHKAFTAETGIEIKLEDYNGGLAEVRAQVDSGAVHWDVVDVELADGVRGCDEGLFKVFDPATLPPGADGSAPEDDYYPDAITECGANTLYYSTVYAYNAEKIPGERPTTMQDFFDLERFPGRRGMRRSPVVNLEFALMGDGVPAEEVYALLDTEEGVERAFAKLDTIKDHVVWWEAGAQPPQMLADGEVLMSTAYNGRIFNAQVLEEQPFVIVWDGQVLDTGFLAILEGAPNPEAAQRFVEFAARPSSMAGTARYISYSPTRRSAEALISTHAETGVAMRPHMPNTPENAERALHNDWEWWSDNRDDMNERFAAWLAR
ncbi:MAG: ABC transporter substrate-binding protein [Gammaproteobacteria bacterium]|nr:ABC transporter substrate-binding protein [Gammaproteobacteria bacterium]